MSSISIFDVGSFDNMLNVRLLPLEEETSDNLSDKRVSNEALQDAEISKDKIVEWLGWQIKQEGGPAEGKMNERIRIVAKTSLALIIISGNLVFSSASPDEIPYMKPAFAAGCVFSSSLLDLWALEGFIRGTFPSESELEKVFPTREASWQHTGLTVLNILNATIIQLPFVYSGMQYNPGSLSILCGILAGLRGIAIPARSTQLFMKKYFDLIAAEKTGINPKRQELFIQFIYENKQRFINMDATKQAEFIEGLKEIRKTIDPLNPSKQRNNYWNHLIRTKSLKSPDPLTGMAYGSTQAAKLIGVAFTANYLFILAWYTFAKTKENILNNDVFAGVASGWVTASTAYLMGSAMVNSSVRLFHTITGINKSVYTSQESLAEKFRRKTMMGLQGAGVILDLLALGVSYTIERDFLKNKTERTFFEVTMCCSFFLLFYSPIGEVISGCMEQSLSRLGTTHEQASIAVAREYQNHADSISRISPNDFEKFSEYLPQEIEKALPQSKTENENADQLDIETA